MSQSISLTEFVDVVLKSGMPRANKVSQIKNKPKYSPSLDFYKPLRESIIEAHQNQTPKSHFRKTTRATVNPKKLSNYDPAIDGYCKWWGNKKLTWKTPPRTTYSKNGIEVIINPELGLEWNGQLHIIKLYLKSDQLAKNRADLILNLLNFTLAKQVAATTKFGLLDVRKGKLFTNSPHNQSVQPIIDAEIAYIAALWPTV